jgi:hypothetical protein
MPIPTPCRAVVAVLFLSIAPLAACDSGSSGAEHTLVLKSGRILEGELRGRSDEGFRFAVGDEVKVIPEQDVFSLTLGEGEEPFFLASTVAAAEPEPVAPVAPPQAAPRPAPAPVPAPVAAPAPPAKQRVTLPRGTRLMVRLDEDVSTATHPRGAPVSGTLDTALAVDGKVLAPRGTKVYGRVIESSGGKRVGSQKLVVEFTDLTLNDQLVPIDTDRVGAEGGGGSGVRKVGAGAMIGGALGGKSGAGKGAIIGAGLSVLGGGGQIRVPSGTLMELHLRSSLTVES